MKRMKRMKKIFPFLLFIILILLCIINPIFDKKQEGLNHDEIVKSESAYDSISLVCSKSFEDVKMVYPNIKIKEIPIYLYKGDFKNKYKTETNGYFYNDSLFPFIVLNKNRIYQKRNIKSYVEITLTHELLHYVDFLKGGRNEKMWSSENINMDIVDENITNEKYFIDKLFFIYTSNYHDRKFFNKLNLNYTLVKYPTIGIFKDVKLKNYFNTMSLLKDEYNSYFKMKNYYKQKNELFVRINLLKIKMFKYNIIERDDFHNLKDGLSRENIYEFIRKNKNNNSLTTSYINNTYTYYNILLTLKWDWKNN